ncbi:MULTISPECIES: helix-turn-helix domain-containing protein [Gordonia]|uniref:Helix-turn-helix transcriptional regulator n=1 Tax=Gordonia amicalis TaxID=89053 RepID=A0AAE4U6U1_9ACTN|nr:MULTISPECIES: helix-turn-helix transcriptional regulator [Gordonia]ATD69440.1 transcriptional regulator [Gordonia sp. 1D]MCZ4579962.1 helix-turn-helix transcriptional regulator [Gordonia amicalis]MDJ0451826.1 helix-turn-helix transcriptional regulator [Gordonia amicalis]MDV6313905.1 helix-turn-helix transcriptional regulator [Gordonia amicalis]MDV7076088.1 helix-turn-helix transcriptional regulator [Gordonia amicalis]
MKREKDEASVDAVVDGRAESGDHVSEDGPTAMAVEAVEAVEAVATAAQDAVTNVAQDIGAFIRSQRVAAKVSLRQLAERAGVSNPYLSQIERGLRKPSADVLAQIAKGLRVSAEVLYVRAGILEERPASPVRDALIADDSINERQKQMLLEIYESFRKENSISPTDHE